MLMVFFFFTVIVMLNVLIGMSSCSSFLLLLFQFSMPRICLVGPYLTLPPFFIPCFSIMCLALINNAISDGDQSWQLDWMEYRMRYIESAENMTYDIPGKDPQSKKNVSCRKQNRTITHSKCLLFFLSFCQLV